MNLTHIVIASSCMRFEAIHGDKIRRVRRDRTGGNTAKHRRFTKRQIVELLFENCIDCEKMATIPQGAFAACKIRDNDERATSMRGESDRTGKENVFNPRPLLEGWELTPLKYNSKLMNSIWGQYNRYSVHNFKKNTDAEEGACGGVAAAIWGAKCQILENHPPVANVAATAVAEAPRIIHQTGNGF